MNNTPSPKVIVVFDYQCSGGLSLALPQAAYRDLGFSESPRWVPEYDMGDGDLYTEQELDEGDAIDCVVAKFEPDELAKILGDHIGWNKPEDTNPLTHD